MDSEKIRNDQQSDSGDSLKEDTDRQSPGITINNNHPRKGSMKGSDIKEEPKDDIKNYAEDTMNELLGWYGYGKEALSRVSDQMRKKLTGDDVPLVDQEASRPVDSSDDEMDEQESLCSAGRSPGAPSTDSMPTLSREGGPEELTVTEYKADEPTFVVCSWCQKGKSLEKQYVLLTSEGRRKFCSQQCFDQCRREKYRKHKICEWCKENCMTSNVVEFEDGEAIFLFCSEDCLNKYKMNIFCQETQEHMKALQQNEGGTTSQPPPETSSAQIIITPDLWNGKEGNGTKPSPEKHSNDSILASKMIQSVASSVGRNMAMRESLISQASHLMSQSRDFTTDSSRSNRQTRSSSSVRVKSEGSGVKPSSSNSRPPRMTDREKIKQIRLRDNLPLYTPLRETCRSNSETYSIASLTSHHPPKSSSTTVSSATAAPTSSKGMYSPSSASQLFGALTAAGHFSKHSPKFMDIEKTMLDDRMSTDSSSSQSISPRAPSQSHNTPLPPLYPPPNPFTHTPLPPYFTNPFNFSSSPAVSQLYSSLYGHSPLLGQFGSPMSGMLPPNTLMMPYPFVLPLPIPVPIPIPVPEKFMEELKKASAKKEEPKDESPSRASSSHLKSIENGNDLGKDTEMARDSKTKSKDKFSPGLISKFTKSKERRRSSETRYYIDLDPSTHCITSSDDVENENEAMDLSTEQSRARSKSKSPTTSTVSSSQEQPNESPILVIQPDESTLSPPPTSPFLLATVAANSANQKYSSRRNLILDAPNVHQASNCRSPSPEKRNYTGPSVRDILYGKRKCARVKTK